MLRLSHVAEVKGLDFLPRLYDILVCDGVEETSVVSEDEAKRGRACWECFARYCFSLILMEY